MSEAGRERSTHDRLTELFTQALALDEDARTVLIDRVRAAEPALAAELESLLAADARADLKTGGLAITVDERPPRSTGRPALDIPGYRVRDVLGEGGMGTVYAGEQLEPHRPVAIKVLHARSANALVRFKTEAQIMARLDHPGIARVLEAGDADGHPYLVMEHVDGATLDAHARDLPLERRLALFVQICDAVHHAHVKGVIHRDLKPSNVMVKGDGRAVILDFGVARLAADDGTTPGETRAGELLGTPLYMSPEQARLRADEVDARSDVYTLGVILYELACKQLPYNVEGLPLPAITVVVCEDPPIPLGKRDPALRGDLEAITLKALAKEAAERYQSVAALAEDVRRFLDGMPVSVRSPGAIERARRFIRRRPVVAAAIGASVIALATFAVVVTALWLEAREARRVAEAARARAEAAGAALEARSNQLALRQARAALARDPTEAIAWLATVGTRDVDAGTAWAVADEAIARGVSRHVLRAHTDEVHWVEPLPGGGFVSAGYDGRAIAWEPPAFTPRVLVTTPRGRVHLARPSPDGSQIAIGCDDGELFLARRDGSVQPLSGHTGDVQHLAWSADGAWLASGDDAGDVRVWPGGAGQGRAQMTDASPVGALAFAQTGPELVFADHAGTIRIANLATETLVKTAVGVDVEHVWLSPARLIVVDVDGNVRVWRRETTGLVAERTIETHQKAKRVAFGPGGAWLVIGSVSGVVVRVTLPSATSGDPVIEQLGVHRAQVRSLAISADGRWIADGGDDGSLELRDLVRGRTLGLRGHAGRIRHLDFAGDVLLSSDSDGVVRRWELATIAPTLFDSRGAPVALVAASADGAWLATVDAEGATSVWSVGDGRRVALGHAAGRVTEVAIAGTTVVTGNADGEVTWWTQPAPVRQKLDGIVKAIAASHDHVAVALSSGAIAVFTLDGTPVATLPGHPEGTETIAFDPSGTLLVSGGQDRVIRVWRRDGETFVAAPPLEAGLRGDTHFVVFAPHGDLVVAGANDGAVVAWSVRDGAIDPASHRVLTRHTGAVTALGFDADGRYLASAGRDATLVRIELGTGRADTARAPAAAIALALDDGGGIHAVTRSGAVTRWTDAGVVMEIDHGVRIATALPGGRWALAFDDGSILVDTLRARSLEELRGSLVAATTFRLARTGGADPVTPGSTPR